jgi:hypothetical protein
VIVSGTSTGFGMGAILRPWIKLAGQNSYRQGTAAILVDASGGFTWQRMMGRTAYVYVAAEDGSVQSNRVTIAAR